MNPYSKPQSYHRTGAFRRRGRSSAIMLTSDPEAWLILLLTRGGSVAEHLDPSHRDHSCRGRRLLGAGGRTGPLECTLLGFDGSVCAL